MIDPLPHLHIHARPPSAPLDAPLDVSLDATVMSLSFESVAERLGELPRMFVEPDGAFVWRGQVATRSWQVDGMLYDRAGQMQRVEWKGACPVRPWRQFLDCLGWPGQPLVALVVDRGRLVAIESLEAHWAAWEAAAPAPPRDGMA